MATNGRKLVSMRRPKAGHPGSEVAMPASTSSDEPEYGYGLMLRLENHELDKLKMQLPDVGQEVMIHAAGRVESVSESQSIHNKGDRSVGIQITDLDVVMAKT